MSQRTQTSPGSLSPLRRRSPSPKKGIRPRTMSPSKTREGPHLEGTPGIFIIYTHTCTFPDDHENPKLIDQLEVDTFTTANFGCPFESWMYDPSHGTFFDDPASYFIEEILKNTRIRKDLLLQKDHLGELKDHLRELIYKSLCYTRDNLRVVNPSCSFRCHMKGSSMADMYVLGAGAPVNEVFIRIDPFTGVVSDVHREFGLVEVPDEERRLEYPDGKIKLPDLLESPIQNFNAGLDALKMRIRFGSPDQKLLDQFKKDSSKLKRIQEALMGAEQSSKYVLKVPDQRGNPMVPLSRLIRTAIDNGTIKRKDFVIVAGCRDYCGELPSDYDTTKSPGRTKDDSDSRGGFTRRRYMYSRKKMVKNNNKNKNKKNKNKKNKRKTIRNRNSRKSRK